MAHFVSQYDMLMALGRCDGNFRAAARLYAERYPQRHHPKYQEFSRIADRIKRTGTIKPYSKYCHRVRPVLNNANTDVVLALVEEDPQMSVRDIGRETDISRSSVHRLLKNEKFRPYHLSVHQALSESDLDQRLRFCHWAQTIIAENPNFFSNVLWTDEATFCSTGLMNMHNAHYWSRENPHWMLQRDQQHRWKVNVWCGIIGDQIIGPHFFETSLNSISYSKFIEQDLPILLEEVPLKKRMVMWFQQDGCPAHYSIRARNVIKHMFSNRCIGRGLHINWPARSPDLTILDYFFWGRLKDLVYTNRPSTVEEMRAEIQNAILSIPPEEIQQAQRDFCSRLLLCINEEGRHFEHIK